jgi:flagellum-specific ATP synthase
VYSSYRQNRDLISVGAYQRGSDARIDEAIAMYPRLSAFLQQNMREQQNWNDSLAGLAAALGAFPGADANAEPHMSGVSA